MVEISPLALNPRQSTVLSAVCRDYIMSGQEVASSRLIRVHGLRWSSATLRQELAVLERAGYVHRAHRSAGCLPTTRGIEHYVGTLPRVDAPRPELALTIDRGLGAVVRPPAEGMRATACVLSEVAGCVAVSFVGDHDRGCMVDVEVLPLVGSRALVALAMDDGRRFLQPVQLDGSDDERPDLLAVQARLRWLCCNRTFEEARARVSALQSEREARFDRVLAEAVRLGSSLCATAGLDPLWLEVAGQPNLAGGLAQSGRLAEVLALLEDVQRLADVLCQLLPKPGPDGSVAAEVRVGTAGSSELTSDAGPRIVDGGVEGLTLVGCRVPPGGPDSDGQVRTGAVALLGTDRMDYAAVIPLVEYTAKALAARTCA